MPRTQMNTVHNNNNNHNNKGHTRFRPATHQGTPYLSRYIAPDNSHECRFTCLSCKERNVKPFDGYCENLKVHLKGKSHSKAVNTLLEERELEASINFLEGNLVQYPHIPRIEDADPIGEIPQTPLSNNDVLLKFDIVNFLITNNMAFSHGEKLLNFVKEITNKYEKKTIQDASIYDKQVSFIAKDCIASHSIDQIFMELQDSPFSISVDGGSDKSGKAFLAVTARYFRSKTAVQPVTRLLGLLELGDSSTGEVCFQKVHDFLFAGPSKENLRKNFLGICTDGSSNMISEKEAGLTNRLRAFFKRDIFVTHDYAHVFNLVIKQGIDQFPCEITSIVSNISSYFSRSPQRKARFRDFQAFLGIKKPVEVLKFVEHRWLSLRDSVERILLLLDPLTLYFETYGTKKEKEYLKAKNVLYLKVLSSLLTKFGHYIKLFEEEDLTTDSIIKALRESVILVSDLLFNLPEIDLTIPARNRRFEEIVSYNYQDPDSLQNLPLRELEEFAAAYVKEYPHLEADFSLQSEEDQAEVFQAAYDFLKEALITMNEFLPLREEGLFDSEVISFKKFDMDAWSRVRNRFPNLIESTEYSAFQAELLRFKGNISEFMLSLNNYGHGGPEVAGNEIVDYRFSRIWLQIQRQYPLLFRIARALMTYPFSSCSIERLFSSCTDIKTLKRNRLSVKSLEACLLVKQEHGDKAVVFSDAMLEKFRNPREEILQDMPLPDPVREIQTDDRMQIEGSHPIRGGLENMIHSLMVNTSKSILEATASGFKQLFSEFQTQISQVQQSSYQPLNPDTLKRRAVEVIERRDETKRLHGLEEDGEEQLIKAKDPAMEEEYESDEDGIIEILSKKE